MVFPFLNDEVALYVEMIENKDDGYVEYFPCFDLRLLTNRNEDIMFSHLIVELKKQGFNLDGRLVSYFSQEAQMYVNCGIDPIH